MVSIRSLIAIIFLIHAQGSLSARLTYFYARVLAVVCFGGGHRTLYKKQLYALDVLFRKLCRSCVSPPSDTDRSLEWHEIFHRCNDRARTFTQTVGPKPWSYCVCMQHWKLASHIVNLLEHRAKTCCLESTCRIPNSGKEAPHRDCLGPWLEETKCHYHWSAFFEACDTWGQM